MRRTALIAAALAAQMPVQAFAQPAADERTADQALNSFPVLYGACHDPVREAKAEALLDRYGRAIDRFKKVTGHGLSPGEILLIEGDACSYADYFDHEVSMGRRLLSVADQALSRLERRANRSAAAAQRVP